MNDVTTLDVAGVNGQNLGNIRHYFGGTSASTPCVAGVGALILSRNSELTLQATKDAIKNGCEQVGDETYVDGKALHYGYGRANAYRSLSLFTPADTTVPVVSSVVTKTGRQVEVTFSEKMGSAVTTPANYTLSGSGKGTLASNPASVSWVSGYKYLLEWSAGEMITGTGNITISVGAGVKDVAGNSVGSPNSGNANGSRVIHAINCGQGRSIATYPIYPFESQRNYWSGSPTVGLLYLSDTVNGIQQADGTPIAVYTSEKLIYANTSYQGDLVYTLPNLTGGINHTVRLYFFNNGLFLSPGEMVFDVVINGVTKLSQFDLIGAVAGTRYYGLWLEFPNIMAQNGAITIRIVPRLASNSLYSATISGIKVTAQ